ncbi:MAG: VWA domain-containing protein [Acidobacteria bacterium]|nr:VWA domain-containing protein [Acidobacteriota bacterium]
MTITRRDLLALAPAAAAAQKSSADPVFRVDVRLVRLLVNVRGPDGQLVGGLERDEFLVSDSGVEQQVSTFERQTAIPLSIALLVDTSASTAKDLKYELNAAGRFVKAVVREGNPADSLALYSFNHDVTLQSSFTRNPARIEKALPNLKAEAGTSLYDAIVLSRSNLPGARAAACWW